MPAGAAGPSIGDGSVAENRRLRHEVVRLKAVIRRNESLLRETDHRLKNSLQFIATMMSLKRSRVHDPEMKHLLQDMIGRIHAIAQQHALLDPQGDRVEISGFMRELAGSLARTMALKPSAIEVKVSGEAFEVAQEDARSLGIVATELLMNAVKHAGRGRASCLIQLRLCRLPEGQMRLEIEDDGPGFPQDFDLDHPTGLGTRIVTGTIAQNGGRLAIPGCGIGARIVVDWNLSAVGTNRL